MALINRKSELKKKYKLTDDQFSKAFMGLCIDKLNEEYGCDLEKKASKKIVLAKIRELVPSLQNKKESNVFQYFYNGSFDTKNTFVPSPITNIF
jgi:hypothetical protein